MKKIKLKDIADISLGYSFRGTLPTNSSSKNPIFVLQAKDVVERTTLVEPTNLVALSPSEGPSRDFTLRDQDIAFVYRTSPGKEFRASTLHLNTHDWVIASSSIIIIRLQGNEFLSDYVTAYLNSSQAQKELQQMASGGSIISVPISEFRNLKIPCIAKKEQYILVDLLKNMQKQTDIMHRTQALRYKIQKNIIHHFTS